jgi:hypothetical protein
MLSSKSDIKEDVIKDISTFGHDLSAICTFGQTMPTKRFL